MNFSNEKHGTGAVAPIKMEPSVHVTWPVPRWQCYDVAIVAPHSRLLYVVARLVITNFSGGGCSEHRYCEHAS